MTSPIIKKTFVVGKKNFSPFWHSLTCDIAAIRLRHVINLMSQFFNDTCQPRSLTILRRSRRRARSWAAACVVFSTSQWCRRKLAPLRRRRGALEAMAAREGAAGVRRVTRLLAMKTAGPVLKSGGPILLLRHSTTQVVPADDRIKISSFQFFLKCISSPLGRVWWQPAFCTTKGG